MSEIQMTIKEVSGELHVSPKDLLHALRTLGIPAKSAASPVPAEYMGRIRAHFKAAGETTSPPRQEIQPGVIVRRRRRHDEEPIPALAATAHTETSANMPTDAPIPHVSPDIPVNTSAKTAPSEPVVKKKAEHNRPKPVNAKIISRPGAIEPTPTARIISHPKQDGVTPQVGESPPSVEKHATPEAAITPDVAAAPKVIRHTTPDASAVPEGSSAPTLPQRTSEHTRPRAAQGSMGDEGGETEDRRRFKKKKPAEMPQVRIISRPSPGTAPHTADTRTADARPPARPFTPGARPMGQRPPARSGSGGGVPRPTGDTTILLPNTDTREGQSKKKRSKGRRTVDFAQGGDFGRRGDEENTSRLGVRGKSRRKTKDNRPLPATTQPLKAAKRKLRVAEFIRVADMAHQMGLKSNEIIKVLFGLGIMATINQSLDIETATLVAAEFEYEVEKAGFSEDDYLIPTESDAPESLLPRPPVVTIMGHVDHGKTSLLDAIRKSNITGGEAGGITQHIGAYHVRTKRGEIVFLDTPGHEAFTAMRARGAKVTDLVVLVVAADDGVMEQTREAINHSKAAGVPIMVAVNKMDKPGADPDRVLRELAELGLQSESWGGDTVTAMVSAKTREGLDDLLELVALQAEILELKANPHKAARGRIVEAKLDKGRGPVATVLIQEGTLKQGDNFICGVFSGRVRALFNDQGKKTKDAGPAIPVEVQGFDGVPEAGEEFICVTDEKLARRIADTRSIKQRERVLAKESKITLETFLSRSASDQEALTLNLVLKADVQGSLEAIADALVKQSTEKVRINVVHGGAGAISESDILLASASQAIIIGFNVRPTAKIKDIAENENVDIRFYNIIYKLMDDIKAAMTGMLAPVQREVYLGQAEVRDTFTVPKVGTIAGCHVSDGKMTRNAGVRLLRDGVVVYTGKITSLKRFKDDAREVLKGYECGIGLENFNDIKNADVIETFEIIEEAATL